MKLIRKHARLIAVAVTCTGLGAGVSAVASAGASTTSPSAHPVRSARALGVLRRGVGGEVTVATKRGFATVSFERGTVKAVNGRQLTMAQGTRSKTYKTITLTIPANAKVRDNGQSATLATVTPGQRVVVVQGPALVHVIARTPRTP